MKHYLSCILLLLFIALHPAAGYAQQDPRYSLYMFNKMLVNPAAAGSVDALRATLIARDQWLGIPGSPKTAALMIEGPVSSKKIGWGAEVVNDQIGPTSSTTIQGNYAYHVPVFKGQLSMGIGLGLYNYVIDFSKISYKDQSDPYNNLNRSQKLVPNAEAGLYYYSHTFYVGVSVNHLVQSKLTSESYDSAAAFRPHAYFIMGQGFTLSSNLLFSPSITLDFAQNSPTAADLNLDFLLDEKVWLGLTLRSQYGIGLIAAFHISSMFQLGYAYEAGLNGIGKAGGGAHEISLTIDFGKNKTVQASPRYF